ncbi:MAG TPA: amino acid racemase [Pyrinomonadaceae bacterium]|nr:amino acid racemase [Pyrinomonadaceae bacterium]
MKTLGLIGGIGPESTIDYYRLLISGYREETGGTSPPVIINSVDLKRLLAWMNADQLPNVVDYLSVEISKLHKAGADFGALASNTPHIVFSELQERSPIPLISIVEATCERVKELGYKIVALFGTRFTMQARFYPDVFKNAGLELVLPSPDQQNYIHEKYMGELLNNQFLPETRERILQIADDLKQLYGVEGLILGGTELPLLLRAEEHNGIRLLDTSRIHVDRLLHELLS